MLDLNGDADEVNQLAKRKDPRGAARCVLSLGWWVVQEHCGKSTWLMFGDIPKTGHLI